jgi:hypothetical protein
MPVKQESSADDVSLRQNEIRQFQRLKREASRSSKKQLDRRSSHILFRPPSQGSLQACINQISSQHRQAEARQDSF